MESSLPNIVGHDIMDWYGVHSGLVANNDTIPGVAQSGAFLATKFSNDGTFGGAPQSNPNGLYVARGIAFNASLSHSVYGKNPNPNAVVPWSLSTRYYIKY